MQRRKLREKRQKKGAIFILPDACRCLCLKMFFLKKMSKLHSHAFQMRELTCHKLNYLPSCICLSAHSPKSIDHRWGDAAPESIHLYSCHVSLRRCLCVYDHLEYILVLFHLCSSKAKYFVAPASRLWVRASFPHY